LAALLDTWARSSTSSAAQRGRCPGTAAHTAPGSCLRVLATCRNQQHSVRCRCCRSSKWRAVVRRCKSRKQLHLHQRSRQHRTSCRKMRQSWRMSPLGREHSCHQKRSVPQRTACMRSLQPWTWSPRDMRYKKTSRLWKSVQPSIVCSCHRKRSVPRRTACTWSLQPWTWSPRDMRYKKTSRLWKSVQPSISYKQWLPYLGCRYQQRNLLRSHYPALERTCLQQQ